MTDPSTLRYTAQHEWLRIEGDEVTVGITDYAASQLGELVYAALPAVGERVGAGSVAGEVESTKSVGEVFAPIDGEVIAVNDELDTAPEIVNDDPFGRGWLFRMRVDPAALDAAPLLGLDEYRAGLGG